MAVYEWANLQVAEKSSLATNQASGGFLGLPGDTVAAEWRVVDVLRREGDKLTENWGAIQHTLKNR